MAEEFRKSLEKSYAFFNEALKEKDVDKLASVYHSKATMCPPGAPSTSGADELRQALIDGFIKPGIVNIEVDRKEATPVEETGIETAEFKCFTDSGECIFVGKYVVVWKKEDGQWKNYIDIFNSDK